MIRQAIAKIKAEVESTEDDMTKMLGHQVMDIINASGNFGQVLHEDRTLENCRKALDDYAGNHRNGARSCIGPKQAASIIEKYYRINAESKNQTAPQEKSTINVLELL